MNEHPWDDLTDEELQEMVDFCRKYFLPSSEVHENEAFVRSIAERPAAVQWDWKKGDWGFLHDKEIHLCVGYDDEGHNKGQVGFYTFIGDGVVWYDNTSGFVPLPLAYQWLTVFPRQAVITTEPLRCMSMEVSKKHPNIHYASYLAFRKVIENE